MGVDVGSFLVPISFIFVYFNKFLLILVRQLYSVRISKSVCNVATHSRMAVIRTCHHGSYRLQFGCTYDLETTQWLFLAVHRDALRSELAIF